jgi:hypothetical protein
LHWRHDILVLSSLRALAAYGLRQQVTLPPPLRQEQNYEIRPEDFGPRSNPSRSVSSRRDNSISAIVRWQT